MSKGLVLVVDDEENILSSLEGILHDDGYDVVTVDEGETALNIIESDHPDLVLLDIWLPGMDGIEVLKSAKRTGVEAEFIMMSGHGSIDTAVQATKLGAFDFIEKPLSLEGVLLMVKLAMERRKKQVEGAREESVRGKIDQFIGTSESANRIREQLKTLWPDEKHITITGEEGTGKSLIAGLLCSQIQNAGRPCVKVDCVSLPKKQANKVLLGAGVKGNENIPAFGAANGGSIVLDGLDQLPLNVQSNILKAFKNGFRGAKSKKEPGYEVRIIAVLSAAWERKIEEGGLNRELMEFLGAERIFVPPLRERYMDIEPLANFFLSQGNKDSQARPAMVLGKGTLETLTRHSWPGNVKELRSALENIHIADGSKQYITPDDLPDPIRQGSPKLFPKPADGSRRIKDADFLWDKESLLYHMRKNQWDIKAAAKAMRLPADRLEKKLAVYGLDIESLKRQTFTMQKTLKRSVVLCGQGLHSGIKTGLILSPLPPDSGIVFCDISTGETIRAHLDYVDSTDFATGLRKGKKVVRTIEHILAVLHMYRINNLLIKMGDEVPIMDGSASDFCGLVEDGGLEEQDVFCEELVIDKVYEAAFAETNGKSISIGPAESLSIHYTLEYPAPIGRQEFLFESAGKEYFKNEIAPARTFGFLKDYGKLEEMGLASGGRLSNLILLDDGKVLNTALRFPDEFVRHKILDILGDIYLLGRPVRGKITARMTGHRENIALLRMIKAGHPDFL
ncbi:MAG: UDP-3-O-[3-hydroxymyristoyl] N-acetylglucosamine deacetylase [Nitrospinae bacterium]|nr:UDP-3-O-[3-hydroxymyristoyl] N-acetylglucosamine deacetylase [Nitrospinota bacterium]